MREWRLPFIRLSARSALRWSLTQAGWMHYFLACTRHACDERIVEVLIAVGVRPVPAELVELGASGELRDPEISLWLGNRAAWHGAAMAVAPGCQKHKVLREHGRGVETSPPFPPYKAYKEVFPHYPPAFL
ncbi:hypothetical protein CCM_03077 [Cordyceps militaris CM01]|uniref:Uncharacterized protein n=1 Tax=Cordyceps militaris (strain CM01) TaxID=983644 RepID=G3J8L9_CORMM|nr:uncharacterized protein CCM_03077 [Cordyceps militaris CM01]EGX94806.1 hypothetical protein CCM_03077 [Cordyceps militaris CM01]